MAAIAAEMESCSHPFVSPITSTCFRWTCFACGGGGSSPFDCANARLPATATATTATPRARVRNLRPRPKGISFIQLHQFLRNAFRTAGRESPLVSAPSDPLSLCHSGESFLRAPHPRIFAREESIGAMPEQANAPRREIAHHSPAVKAAPERIIGIVGVADPPAFSIVTPNAFAGTPLGSGGIITLASPIAFGLN